MATKLNEVSLVIPAYKEKPNLRKLCQCIFAELKKTMPKLKAEILIVDDNSQDGSEELIQELAKEGYNIRIEVRKNERGLSSAVVHGFHKAKYDAFVVMDADLQHDPKYLPSVIRPIIEGTADFTVGSRNIGGGKVEDWPLIRKLISFGATLLARPLAACTDPMSGFFGIRRSTWEPFKDKVNPIGYKIGLELMVRCRCKNVKEVPIVFRDREEGESKLTMKQNLLYLMQLGNLYIDRFPVVVASLLVLFIAVLYYLMNLIRG